MKQMSLKEPDKGPKGECEGCKQNSTCQAWWRKDVEENGAITVCVDRKPFRKED